MKARFFLSLVLLAAICVSMCERGEAQAPNPLEEAAPCKLAGVRAEQIIGGTTKAADYASTLRELRATIGDFVAKAGENAESSLHCLNHDGGTLLRLGELEEAAKVYRRVTEIAGRNFGDDDDSTLTLQGNLAVRLTSKGPRNTSG
jgi:hypothetical protein